MIMSYLRLIWCIICFFLAHKIFTTLPPPSLLCCLYNNLLWKRLIHLQNQLIDVLGLPSHFQVFVMYDLGWFDFYLLPKAWWVLFFFGFLRCAGRSTLKVELIFQVTGISLYYWYPYSNSCFCQLQVFIIEGESGHPCHYVILSLKGEWN